MANTQTTKPVSESANIPANYITSLRQKHRALDEEIHGLANDPLACSFKEQHLKRQRLAIRDKLASLGIDTSSPATVH